MNNVDIWGWTNYKLIPPEQDYIYLFWANGSEFWKFKLENGHISRDILGLKILADFLIEET